MLYLADFLFYHYFQVKLDEFEFGPVEALVHQVKPQCLETATQSNDLDVLPFVIAALPCSIIFSTSLRTM